MNGERGTRERPSFSFIYNRKIPPLPLAFCNLAGEECY